MIIPYIEIPISSEGHSGIIEEVIIGPTPHNELSKGSVKMLLANNNFASKNVKCSSTSYRSW